MPVRLIITEGTAADCNYAIPLIEGIFAEHLLADRGYDSNDIISQAIKQGIDPVIPPKKNRKDQREYDKYIYKLRHLKQWRGIATRYAKNTKSFVAAVHIRCILIWAKIL